MKNELNTKSNYFPAFKLITRINPLQY